MRRHTAYFLVIPQDGAARGKAQHMTHFPVLRLLIGIVLATLGLLLAWGTDLPKGFGAHPWWSTDVVWIGGVAGVLAGLAMHRTPRIGVTAFLLISVLGFLAAR